MRSPSVLHGLRGISVQYPPTCLLVSMSKTPGTTKQWIGGRWRLSIYFPGSPFPGSESQGKVTITTPPCKYSPKFYPFVGLMKTMEKKQPPWMWLILELDVLLARPIRNPDPMGIRAASQCQRRHLHTAKPRHSARKDLPAKAQP